jgi:hypothetical protein
MPCTVSTTHAGVEQTYAQLIFTHQHINKLAIKMYFQSPFLVKDFHGASKRRHLLPDGPRNILSGNPFLKR